MKHARLVFALSLAMAMGIGMIAGNALSKAHVRVTPLLKSDLAGNEGREAIMAVVDFAPGIELPKHYHPGEELGYLLEGSAVLIIAGRPDRRLGKGDAFYIPSRKVHGAGIGGEGAKLLSIRIHEKGQPIRIPVN